MVRIGLLGMKPTGGEKSPWCGVLTRGLKKEASMKTFIEPTFPYTKTKRMSMPQESPESDQTQIFRYVGCEGRQFEAIKIIKHIRPCCQHNKRQNQP
jgi:hypothetical protein